MCGKKAVLGDDSRCQSELGNAVSDNIEVCRLLCRSGEQLEEARVVDAVVVVVARVHIQGSLGHRSGADIQHIGQALAHRGIQRLMHIGNALARGEIRRAQSRHGQACRYRGSGVFTFRLDENQRASRDIDMALGGSLCPVLTHLGGGRNRISPRRITGFALAHNDRGITVHGRALTREFEGDACFTHVSSSLYWWFRVGPGSARRFGQR